MPTCLASTPSTVAYRCRGRSLPSRTDDRSRRPCEAGRRAQATSRSGRGRRSKLGPRPLIEKRPPRQRFSPGFGKISVFQMLADASQVLAKEGCVRQLECALIGRPEFEFPGGDEQGQHRRFEIADIVGPSRRGGPDPDALRQAAELPAEAAK